MQMHTESGCPDPTIFLQLENMALSNRTSYTKPRNFQLLAKHCVQ